MNATSSGSLRRRLMLWMLVPVLLVSTVLFVDAYRGAREAARRAVDHAWPRPSGWVMLAAMELTLGDPAAALDVLDRGEAAGVAPDALALVNRAACLRHLGRHDEAEAVVARLVATGVPEAEARARVDRLAPPPR